MEGVRITSPFLLKEGNIVGAVDLAVSDHIIRFDVEINPFYPFQLHEQETIKFINKDLLSYNHVNADGSICIHTVSCPELTRKINIDFRGLFHWIKVYYINNESDTYYEHLVGTNNLIENEELIFLFTDVDYSFIDGEFGLFKYTFHSKGRNRNNAVNTFLVQAFVSGKETIETKWSHFYKQGKIENGVFAFIENPPTVNGRFLAKTWNELESMISQEFLTYLYQLKSTTSRENNRRTYLPLLIGYKIPGGETHWQCAIIKTDNFPNYGEKIPGTGKYKGRLYEEEILWVGTKNSSYQHFFGRGALNERLVNSNILMTGIGAIGSMVATTLVRGGCKTLTLLDYDVKEPENICRSEYFFTSGVNLKTHDLGLNLTMISPFVEIRTSEYSSDYMKILMTKDDKNGILKDYLSEYDFIIDCTTDNDVIYMIDKIQPDAQTISLSITNHAKHLICSVGADTATWTQDNFERHENDKTELYEPIGCWNPTFKASYNDISMLVQIALNHINKLLNNEKPLRNFVISTEDDSTNIKIKEF